MVAALHIEVPVPQIVEELVERPEILERSMSSSCSSSTVVDVPVLMQGLGLQFLDKVVYMPVASNDRCFRLTVQNTMEFPQLHVDVCWQFIDGCGRPCAHAETQARSWWVPQNQFIA